MSVAILATDIVSNGFVTHSLSEEPMPSCQPFNKQHGYGHLYKALFSIIKPWEELQICEYNRWSYN